MSALFSRFEEHWVTEDDHPVAPEVSALTRQLARTFHAASVRYRSLTFVKLVRAEVKRTSEARCRQSSIEYLSL